MNDGWNTKKEEVKEICNCDMVQERVTVSLSTQVIQKINLLMDKMGHLEWLAYLIGEGFYVKDIVIPKQTVSSGFVDNIHLDDYGFYPIIGVLHSHHDMGSFFSGTDDEWINSNHNISIVVTRNKRNKSSLEFGATCRIKTPCGSFKRYDKNHVDVVPAKDYIFDHKDFVRRIEENIVEQTFIEVDEKDGQSIFDQIKELEKDTKIKNRGSLCFDKDDYRHVYELDEKEKKIKHYKWCIGCEEEMGRVNFFNCYVCDECFDRFHDEIESVKKGKSNMETEFGYEPEYDPLLNRKVIDDHIIEDDEIEYRWCSDCGEVMGMITGKYDFRSVHFFCKKCEEKKGV